METYQINDLERLSGVKAATIRAWEKRYDFLAPERTDTNRRLYNDADVARLLNIVTLQKHGYKISALAGLSDKEIIALLQQTAQEVEAATAPIYSNYISNLVTATLHYDEAAFDKAFSTAIKRLGLHTAMLQVVYPFLSRIGLMWNYQKVSSVQEHFATSIVRRKLHSAIDGLPIPQKKSKKFLMFLPPDEWHEIGLLFADYLVRAAGWPSVYLGQSVPFAQLQNVIKHVKPTHLLTFFISRRPDGEINTLLAAIRKSFPGLTILFAGDDNMLQNIKLLHAMHYLKSPNDLSMHI